MSTNSLKATFEKAGAQITCLECQAMLQARIREVCQQWFDVKVRVSVINPSGSWVTPILHAVYRERFEWSP